MCMQCMAGAMTAGATATGARCWLQAHMPSWMSARQLVWVTRVIIAAALVASTVALGGAG